MSNTLCLPASARWPRFVLIGAFCAFSSSLYSQSASDKRVPTSAQLAKYDLNRNGLLDTSEQAAFEAEEKTDTVLLTPFEVSTNQDRGYAAGNTLSGGRIDTPLAVTPGAISVITKEFLNDFAITDINEAAQWTMNMDLSGNQNSGPFGGDRFESNFRGAGNIGGQGPTRDGLQQYFIADSYNSERFEMISGPNSAIAGLGGPGGMLGSSSKRARFNTNFGEVATRGDSFGGYRGTIDYNYGLDRIAVRVNALHQNVKSYQKHTSNKQNAITLATSFKITDKTLLSLQYEKSSEWNIQYNKRYNDQASFWNRTTVNLDNTLLPVTPAGERGTGLSLISQNNDRLTYNFGTNSLINYRGVQYQTSGLNYAIPWGGRPDLPQEYPGSANFKKGIGKDFFLGPIDNIADRDHNMTQVVLDHTFTSNLSARFTFQSSDVDPTVLYSQSLPGDYRIDVNRLLPDGSVNPNYLQAYGEWTQNSQHQQDSNDEYSGQVNYKFAIPKWFDLKQSFNVIAGYRFKEIDAWDRAWARNNNPLQLDPANDVNRLRFRQYYGQAPGRMQPILNQEAMNKLVPGVTWGNYGTTGYHAYSTRGLKYGQIYSMTSFFDDRLVISGNIRRDQIFNGDMNRIGSDPTKNYAIRFGSLNPKTGVNEEGFTSRLYAERTSFAYGAVIYPFPNRFTWLRPIGFVYNYSENFQVPNAGGPFYTGERPEPPFNKTSDYAIRFSIPGGKVYGEVRRYRTTSIGALSNMSNEADIRDIWINLGYTDPAKTGFGGFRDTSDRELSGTEFEITANPTSNWTLRANYGHPNVKQILERKLLREYVAANITEWRAGANAQPGQVLNGQVVVSPTLVAQNIQDIENSFNGLTTGTLGNGPRHRGSFASSYRFAEGRLKGVGVSAGLSWRGKSKQGSRDPRIKYQVPNGTAITNAQNLAAAYDYLYVPSQLTNNVGVNYRRRFGKVEARFQLNVTNVLNEEGLEYTGYSTINAGQLTNQQAAQNAGEFLTVAGSNPRLQVPNNVNQYEPRKFVFSTTLTF